MSTSKVAAPATGLSGAVKLCVKTFLEQRHYQQLIRILADQWSGCHSLTAAVKLMEAHGVFVSKDEEERLSKLSEERLIDALVMRMPQQSREQFEHFFLQLSLIASTTTRLRAALEGGNADAIEEVMDSAENVGILPYILKMAVAQAGTEVKAQEADHEQWLASTDRMMSPLLQSQTHAMAAQKALMQMQTALGISRVEASEKSKKVLLGIASGADKALVHSVCSTWIQVFQREKREREIRKEYEEQLDGADRRLRDYVSAQVGMMKNMLTVKANMSDMALVQECFDAMKGEVKEARVRKQQEEELSVLDAEMKRFNNTQAAKSKKALARMADNSEGGIVLICFQAWIQFMDDYRKDKELEDAVKASESKVKDMMKKQNNGARSVLDRMAGSGESSFLTQILRSWIEVFKDEKQANELQDILNSNSGRFNEFSKRNKATAGSCMDRAAEIADTGTTLTVFLYWKKEMKVERLRRWAREKNGRKKDQLIKVKGLFKNFASELENGLKEGTPRMDAVPRKERRARSSQPSPKASPA